MSLNSSLLVYDKELHKLFVLLWNAFRTKLSKTNQYVLLSKIEYEGHPLKKLVCSNAYSILVFKAIHKTTINIICKCNYNVTCITYHKSKQQINGIPTTCIHSFYRLNYEHIHYFYGFKAIRKHKKQGKKQNRPERNITVCRLCIVKGHE